ncbi:Hsp20/alpha crystallin family protein [Halostella sp. PRR32]|uniref:Hsp20/alpha crystallin family protein n=1 Tax=Halostella sp. PRR32 TaxID=3098147 RepID=UPI002B1DC78B|nr:Hsp20/alpha crystallin family protein [Halostella sp. PRR32]
MQHNPFDDVQEMLDRMSRQAEEGLLRGAGAELQGIAVDVAEDDEEFVVTADLPGYGTDEIDLTVAGDRLKLEASTAREHEQESESDGMQYHRRERRQKSVSRTLTLPGEVDEDAVSASYANGVLTVILPKREGSTEGRQIDIE